MFGRADKDQSREDSARLPQVAVLTMARDEREMLPVWIRHYAAQVGMDNLIVIDDNSTDGSTDGLPCTVHRIPRLPGDRRYEQARMALVSGLAQGLLAVYDYAVFVDVDEFLIANPARYPSLVSLLADRPDRDVLGAVGLNVVHVVDVEPALDLRRPVLDQRSFAKFAPVMCKPAVKRIPAGWAHASHGIRAPFTIEPELYLLHLKFADRDRLRQVADHRRNLVARDGRASRSSWSLRGGELVEVLEDVTRGVDPREVPEFDAAQVDLGAVVKELPAGVHRTPRQGQVPALKKHPLVRIPAALKGHL